MTLGRTRGHWTAMIKATDTITVVEGYDAMRVFLETVWRRVSVRPSLVMP
jgi:hypothetical protein